MAQGFPWLLQFHASNFVVITEEKQFQFREFSPYQFKNKAAFISVFLERLTPMFVHMRLS
jgi:hypothetical protein